MARLEYIPAAATILSFFSLAAALSAPLYTPQQSVTVTLAEAGMGLRTGSDDVPITDAPWARTVTGTEPEQINLAYHSSSSVMVSWATGDFLH